MLYIGCAGWALEKKHQSLFPAAGTHLQRYAAVFPCVEINSSFYRPHKPETYRRWADSVPEGFRFSVKIPKEITHVRRLKECRPLLDRFLSEALQLGGKLGPLLVQLPPGLRFDADAAADFFGNLRARFQGLVALEPRHASWFEEGVDAMLLELRVARAAANPAVVPDAGKPAGWPGLAYHRLHGSPKLYYSEYPEQDLSRLATVLGAEKKKEKKKEKEKESYCIFDNTAEGHAIPNALTLKTMLEGV